MVGPISEVYDAFVIRRVNPETISWNTFIAAFHWKLWLSIIGMSFGAAIIIWFLWFIHNSRIVTQFETWITYTPANNVHILFKAQQHNNINGVIYSLWVTTYSTFGITVNDDVNDPDATFSQRLALFLVSLSGSLFFVFYSAFLTSALAIPNEMIAFRNPKELLNTNYRCTCWH